MISIGNLQINKLCLGDVEVTKAYLGDVQVYGSTPKYMTMTVDSSNTGSTVISPKVSGSLPNLNLQYRINNGDWKDFIVGTTADITAQPGDVIQWKGVNESGLSIDTSNYLRFYISDLFHLSGNVMSLIDGIGETLVIPNSYCFYYLFWGSKVKTVSSDFLPAIELKPYCYEYMFAYCSSLVQLPELNSQSLKPYCYSYMFCYCKSLKTTTALPAKLLEPHCYEYMFLNCDSLIDAKEISAEILAERCCADMFTFCKSLVQAPVLKAKTMVSGCYNSLFRGCTNLNYVRCLATSGTIHANADSWLDDVAKYGTFEYPAGVDYKYYIPYNWTKKEI